MDRAIPARRKPEVDPCIRRSECNSRLETSRRTAPPRPSPARTCFHLAALRSFLPSPPYLCYPRAQETILYIRHVVEMHASERKRNCSRCFSRTGRKKSARNRSGIAAGGHFWSTRERTALAAAVSRLKGSRKRDEIFKILSPLPVATFSRRFAVFIDDESVS